MATAAALVPLEEYLRTTYHPDRDWVDGELKERNVGEGQHATIQTFLGYLFRTNRDAWNTRALTEQRVQTSARHYRVADLYVALYSNPIEPIVHTPPLLCIEILSKDDRMSEMQDKIEDYLGMGTRTVWVIDPLCRRAFSTDYAGLAGAVPDFLTVRDTPIQISVESIFAELE